MEMDRLFNKRTYRYELLMKEKTIEDLLNIETSMSEKDKIFWSPNDIYNLIDIDINDFSQKHYANCLIDYLKMEGRISHAGCVAVNNYALTDRLNKFREENRGRIL